MGEFDFMPPEGYLPPIPNPDGDFPIPNPDGDFPIPEGDFA